MSSSCSKGRLFSPKTSAPVKIPTRPEHSGLIGRRDETAKPTGFRAIIAVRRDGRVVDGGGLENVSGSVIPRRLYFRRQLHLNMCKIPPDFADRGDSRANTDNRSVEFRP